MKKQTSKLIALALVCAMALPTTAFASNTAPSLSGNAGTARSAGGTISGDGNVDTAVYNVIIPGDVNFAVDKFEVAGHGQIYGVDYPVVNVSAFPVRVNVDISANSVSPNSVFVPTDDDLALTTGTTKAVYFTAVVPEDVDVATISSNQVSGNAGAVSGNYGAADKVIPMSATAPASLSFRLDKYDSTSNALTPQNGSTFTFKGKVNPNADWQDGNVSVKGVFEFVGLSGDTYNSLSGNTLSGNNFIEGGGSGGGIQSKTASKGAPSNIVFATNKKAERITAVGTLPGNTAVKNPVQSMWSSTASTLTIPSSSMVFSAWIADTYTIVATYSDSSTSTFKLVLTN